MIETEVQLKRIQSKLQQLLKQHALMQKENYQLKEDLDDRRKQIALQQDNIDGMKQHVAVLKYSSGDMSEVDKKEFEKKINTYVKEIDRCISMLSQ
jgi:hypothetical protein